MQEHPKASLLLFGDARQLRALFDRRPESASFPIMGMTELLSPAPHSPGIRLVDVGSCEPEVLAAHRPHPQAGSLQLQALEAAACCVREGGASALVTGPTSKEAISAAGVPFTGQTEHLARMAGLASDDVTMMFWGPRLRVALVTTHLALRDVPAALTPQRLRRTLVHLVEACRRLMPEVASPRIVLTGLNPHAGEGGLFGREEIEVMMPLLGVLREEINQVEITGPMAAEAAFRYASSGVYSAVATIMHDQATIASKLLDWSQAVNLTWGLPWIRTSVDHGVAYDAAAKGQADAEGMMAALRLAQRLVDA